MANNFSPEVADKLLEKLSSDDDFRALFEKDPRAALSKLGHETPEADRGVKGSDPLMCVSSKPLASKEQIRAARKDLHTKLSAGPFTFTVFALQSS